MKSFALVGIGDRTNRSGVDQMLKSGLGFDEVGVVHQPSHPLILGDQRDPMINMHLDTYFNVALVVVDESSTYSEMLRSSLTAKLSSKKQRTSVNRERHNLDRGGTLSIDCCT